MGVRGKKTLITCLSCLNSVGGDTERSGRGKVWLSVNLSRPSPTYWPDGEIVAEKNKIKKISHGGH